MDKAETYAPCTKDGSLVERGSAADLFRDLHSDRGLLPKLLGLVVPLSMGVDWGGTGTERRSALKRDTNHVGTKSRMTEGFL